MSPDDIEARFAIQDVMLTYTTSVDDRDFDRYMACFIEDIHVIGFGEEELHGQAALRHFVVTALDNFGTTQHLIAPPLITVSGLTAHARTYVQASHCHRDNADRCFVLWGTYETDFVRIGGRWKIAKHHLVTRFTRDR